MASLCNENPVVDEKALTFLHLGQTFSRIHKLVAIHNPTEKLSEDGMHSLQIECDTFGQCTIEAGIAANLGNYGHYVHCHLVESMNRFGRNIYRYSGQNTEHAVKGIKRDQRHSQNGGHAGGKSDNLNSEKRGSTYAQAKASLRRWMRRIMVLYNSGRKIDEEGILGDAIKTLKKRGFSYASQKAKSEVILVENALF